MKWLEKTSNAAIIIQREFRRLLETRKKQQEEINFLVAIRREIAANIIHRFFKSIMKRRKLELLRLVSF